MVLPENIVEAARGGTASDLETIKGWLDSGGDINDAAADTECTILNLSLVFDNPEIMKFAIARGADVNGRPKPTSRRPRRCRREANSR